MKAIVAPALTLAVLASLSATGAQAAGLNSDVRCLAFADRLAQSTDAKAKETGQVWQIFFLGRINGGSAPPTASALAASMVDAAHSLKGDLAKTEGERCSGIFKGAVALMNAASPIANKSLAATKATAPAR